MAAFVVVTAGIKAASSVLVPFLLAVFLAVIFTPPLLWLKEKKIPAPVTVFVIISALVAVTALFAAFVGASVNEFTAAIPYYQNRITQKAVSLANFLKSYDIEISPDILHEVLNPGIAMQYTASILKGLSGLVANLFLILLTVVFILAEASGFPVKLRAALEDPDRSLADWQRFSRNVNRYIALKTVFSISTEIAVWLYLSVLGIDFALIWGILAFVLNYVPNIGSLIAAFPAVLTALVQAGAGYALLTAAGYAVINTIIGSILEPRFMGSGLGLSALVVFLSLVFWGWVLGPVGMLLSVPLTMIVKIGLENNPTTRWLAILLGDTKSAARLIDHPKPKDRPITTSGNPVTTYDKATDNSPIAASAEEEK